MSSIHLPTPPGEKPGGTIVPEARAKKPVPEGPVWQRFLRWFGGDNVSDNFDPAEAAWFSSQRERRAFLAVLVGLAVLHWWLAYVPCPHSTKAQYLEQRVQQLEKELNEGTRRVPFVPDPTRLPGQGG